MEKLLFPQLTGKWKENIQLNKYVKLLLEDMGTNPFLGTGLFGPWIELLHKTFGVEYSWGGYLENREEMLEGTYLPSGCRNHLGIDFWVPESSIVHLPKDGKLLYSKMEEDQDGGWGGKVIFEIDGLFYIFGHLKDIVSEIGKVYSKGDLVGYVAERGCNGGWYPHLHLQCMKEYNADVDGYGYALLDNRVLQYCLLEQCYPNPFASLV